jgi:hypothetical protein
MHERLQRGGVAVEEAAHAAEAERQATRKLEAAEAAEPGEALPKEKLSDPPSPVSQGNDGTEKGDVPLKTDDQ